MNTSLFGVDIPRSQGEDPRLGLVALPDQGITQGRLGDTSAASVPEPRHAASLQQ